MRWTPFLILGLVMPSTSASGQAAIAIAHVRLVDGTGRAPVEDATVVIKGDRIIAVGPSGSTMVPAGTRAVDGRGQTLLPGLADMHTHLGGGWDGETADFLGFKRTMSSLLYAGVTTVLDPGDVTSFVKQLRDEVNAGRLEGPSIHFAGPVLDGPKPVWPDISAAIGTADQLPHFIKQLKDADVTFVKAYVGLSTPMVRALVDSAAKQSLRVIADVGPRNGSREVAETGIAAFAHAGTRPMSDSTVRYFVDHQVGSITTLAVYESFSRRRFADIRFLDQPLLADVLPPSYRAGLLEHARQPLTAQDSAGMTRMATALATAGGNVKKMADAGVLVVAGTDAPYPGDFYGEGLHRELELLVEAGLSPVQAIAAATGNAARLVKAEREWGTIEPGKRADLLLVRGDPTRRISDTRAIVMVIKRGRIVDRAGLKYDPRREPDYHPAVLRPH